MFFDLLYELNEIWQKTLYWKPTKLQLEQWEKLYREIMLANHKINLTRIIEPKDFWEKHLWDSLAGIDTSIIDIKPYLKVIDIGTGAGFPGIPVAIIYHDLQVTLLDSRKKKIKFIDHILNTLDFNNCQTLIGRSETIGQMREYRESYDLALIRAVGRPSVCAEYALPLLKIGGIAILYRGHWQNEDTLNLMSILEKLGGEIISIKTIKTPLTKSIRNFIYVRKIFKTSRKFPRQTGIAAQNPL